MFPKPKRRLEDLNLDQNKWLTLWSDLRSTHMVCTCQARGWSTDVSIMDNRMEEATTGSYCHITELCCSRFHSGVRKNNWAKRNHEQSISRVPDQNGVSEAYIVEIHHSGQKPKRKSRQTCKNWQLGSADTESRHLQRGQDTSPLSV